MTGCSVPRSRLVARARSLMPNPSLHPTCYGWLRQHPHAGELKRWARQTLENYQMRTIYFSLAILLSACASNSGVVPIGSDTYMVSRQAATGFSGSGTLKAEAFREANEFCLSQKKKLQVVSTTEAQPPYILANFPKAEIQFMCLDANDPELSRPKLKKDADTVIEIRK